MPHSAVSQVTEASNTGLRYTKKPNVTVTPQNIQSTLASYDTTTANFSQPLSSKILKTTIQTTIFAKASTKIASLHSTFKNRNESSTSRPALQNTITTTSSPQTLHQNTTLTSSIATNQSVFIPTATTKILTQGTKSSINSTPPKNTKPSLDFTTMQQPTTTQRLSAPLKNTQTQPPTMTASTATLTLSSKQDMSTVDPWTLACRTARNFSESWRSDSKGADIKPGGPFSSREGYACDLTNSSYWFRFTGPAGKFKSNFT